MVEGVFFDENTEWVQSALPPTQQASTARSTAASASPTQSRRLRPETTHGGRHYVVRYDDNSQRDCVSESDILVAERVSTPDPVPRASAAPQTAAATAVHAKLQRPIQPHQYGRTKDAEMRTVMNFDALGTAGALTSAVVEPMYSDDPANLATFQAVSMSVILLLRVLGNVDTCSMYFGSMAMLPFMATRYGSGWSMWRISDYDLGEVTVTHIKSFIIYERGSKVSPKNVFVAWRKYVYALFDSFRKRKGVEPRIG
jgi:hypothetical protein